MELTLARWDGADQIGPCRALLEIGTVAAADTALVLRTGELNRTRVEATMLRVHAGDVVAFQAPASLSIPRALIHVATADQPAAWKSPATLRAEWDAHAGSAGQKAATAEDFDLMVDDLLRRLRHVEADSSVGLAFMACPPGSLFPTLVGGASAELRLALSAQRLLDAAGNNAFIGFAACEFAVRASVRLADPANVEVSYGLACRLEATGEARLRIDGHGLGFSLPWFILPSLQLGNLQSLALGGPLEGVAASLADFLPEVLPEDLRAKVTFTADPSPQLALRLRDDGRLEWALVDSGTDLPAFWVARDAAPAGALPGLPGLSRLGASVSLFPALALALANIRVASFTDGTVLTADPVAGVTTPRFSRSARLGPLELATTGVVLTASYANHRLGVVIGIDRLSLFLHDEHDTEVAFKLELALTEDRWSVTTIKLLEPYPVDLAIDLVEQGAAAARFVVSVVGQAAEAIGRLLTVLARLMVAIGRATLVAGQAVIDGLNAIGRALAGLAEILARALSQLPALGLPGPSNDLAIEVWLGLAPLELRQVLISLPRQGGPRTLEVVGLRLEMGDGWYPALLIDFTSEPGAYLLLAGEPLAAERPLASIDVDLWLKAGDSDTRRPVADADPQEGEKRSPLIKLETALKAENGAAQRPLIVLAGIRRGNPVFFERIASSVEPVVIGSGAGPTVSAIAGEPRYVPLGDDALKTTIDFNHYRVLPLLGMGETSGKSGGGGFLDDLKKSLGSVVWVKGVKQVSTSALPDLACTLTLGVRMAGVETEVDLALKLSLATLQVSLDMKQLSLPIRSRRIEQRALGLVWIIDQKEESDRKDDAAVEMFALAFDPHGQSVITMGPAARMRLCFDGLSGDGKGLAFVVERFQAGPGGVDLIATVADAPVRLNGIGEVFRFTAGRLEISGSRLVAASAAGRGNLPRQLIGDAACSIALSFVQDPDEGIVLQSGSVELDNGGKAIVCHGTRFTLSLSDIGLTFVRDQGYHFYFLVSGSLRFLPNPGEFDSGLLQYLKDVEVTLERTPLSGDARVLARHIKFQKALNPKKTFNLFNLFAFEVRGFGYHPAADKFDGDPAINISGQIRFGQIGDVAQPSIDFHGLWLAPPAKDNPLPRVRLDGLGLDLNLQGSARVRGTLMAVDDETPSLEGGTPVSDNIKASGFLGDGELDIPGFATIAASFGFLELQRKDRPGEFRKAFFFYAERRKMAIKVVAGPWVWALREVGLGMGFRYTLEALAAADEAVSVPKLVAAMDDVSKRQGDLHKFSAWRPEAEGDRLSLAFKGALQPFPAQEPWKEDVEKVAESPFFFDVVGALRSDFTLFMGLRGWLGTNYHDYLNDREGLRSNPGLRGYLYISAPQRRLLARMIGDSNGYIGQRLAAAAKIDKFEPPLRRALRSIDWSATLFIKPGLFHFELGWPTELAVRLVDEPNMRVAVRGGMIFRASEDGLLLGYNLEADAFFRFSGSAGGGSVGLAVEASLQAHVTARLMSYLTWRFQGSLVYGLISLDAALAFSVRAWMEVDLGFTSFTIRIGFAVSLQLSAAVEMVISTEGIGARVEARVAISVFGCTLTVGLGFSFGSQGALDSARAQVQRFLAMSITSEEPVAPVQIATRTQDERVQADAEHASSAATPLPAVSPPAPPAGAPKVSKYRAQFAPRALLTDLSGAYRLVLHLAGAAPGGGALQAEGGDGPWAYALLVPRDGCFYPAPSFMLDDGSRDERQPVHRIAFAAAVSAVVERIWRDNDSTTVKHETPAQLADGTIRWNAPISTGAGSFTLAHLFDECFLSDTRWVRPGDGQPFHRRTLDWREPEPQTYEEQALVAGTEAERTAQRDLAQRRRQGAAAADPLSDSVHQARGSALQMFIDQFIGFARSGTLADTNAHVVDLGLVFFGPTKQLEAAFANAHVERCERVHRQADAPLTSDTQEPDYEGAPTFHGNGPIEVLNPSTGWFDKTHPILASTKAPILTRDGVKIDWKLVYLGTAARAAGDEGAGNATLIADHYLHHYEISRSVVGQPGAPRTLRIKPVHTEGRAAGQRSNHALTLLAPEWQLVDDLADLSEARRLALLPPRDAAGVRAAAIAWHAEFGDNPVLLAYSIAPVDIAGTRGSPRSVLVPVPRPVVELRPAEAEMRVVVNKMAAVTDKAGVDAPAVLAGTRPPGSLGVYLALKDPSFRKTQTVHGVTTKRFYELIADPEELSPAGQFGASGLGQRGAGTLSGFSLTADSQVWTIPASHFVSRPDAINAESTGDAALRALEPALDTLERFPHWTRVAGSVRDNPDLSLKQLDAWLERWAPDLRPGGEQTARLDALWAGLVDGRDSRVATRFGLRVVEEITIAGVAAPIVSKSPIVAVSVEMHVAPTQFSDGLNLPPRGERGVIRPENFEWPVHLVFPPLDRGQIRARTGFAKFRLPPAARLPVRAGGEGLAVESHLDPDRRVLTSVSFLADGPMSGGIDPLHASAVAGYDLHELDIDDLARLDTPAAIPFELSHQTWSRARRVAAVERVTDEMARLLPDGNSDWQGWHAHYPSESWRLSNAKAPPGIAQSRPMRAPWYSAAESTPLFARSVPRVRLFPTVPESLVSALMARGITDSLVVRLRQRSEGATTTQPLAGVIAAVTPLGAWMTQPSDFPAAIDGDGVRFTFEATPRRLREFLLRLCWVPVAPAGGLADHARFIGDAALLRQVEIAFWPAFGDVPGADPRDATPLATETAVLQTREHSALVELIGELEYDSDNDGLYRRHVIDVQPSEPVAAKTLQDLLAAMPPERDPHGWMALQQFGHAVTLKVFDRDADRFLDGDALTTLVGARLQGVLARYSPFQDAQARPALGQPFVDVLLKPMRNRLGGEFEAATVLAGDAATPSEPDAIDLVDDGLSLVQVALRPLPLPAREYWSVGFGWQTDKTWPTRLDGDHGDTRLVIERLELELELASALDANTWFDVIRVSDGSTFPLFAGASVRVPIGHWPIGRPDHVSAPAAAQLQFLVRAPTSERASGEVVMKATLHVRYQLAGVVKTSPSAWFWEQFHAALGLPNDWPTSGLVDGPSEKALSPASAAPFRPVFEAFPLLSPDAWKAQLSDGAAAPAFASFGRAANAVIARAANQDVPAALPFGGGNDWVSTYLAWCARFLDHAAPPVDEGPATSPWFSVAAPSKAAPWQLSPDRAGWMSLSFLHADRWAHARAYAVRPISRYRNLAMGAGCYADPATADDLLRLGSPDRLTTAIGYALAVVPRTERIEPPVFLGSRVRGDAWEVVLAQHGEEALSASNRPLFARLQHEGTSLSFLRRYRDPHWPQLVAEATGVARYDPDQSTVSPRPPVRPSTRSDVDLGPLVRDYPALWKGARVWRVEDLQPHFRVAALAVSRAGTTVSTVVASVREAPPRRRLAEGDGDRLLGRPRLRVAIDDDGRTVLQIERIRLLSYADVHVDAAKGWISASEHDLARFPEPAAHYGVLRRALAADGSRVEEEAVSVQFRWQQARPADGWIAVRARGSHWLGAPGSADHPLTGRPVVRHEDNPTDVRRFHLGLSVVPKIELAPTLRRRIDAGDEHRQARAQLNARAGDSLAIETGAAMTVRLTGVPAAAAEVRAWLEERRHDVQRWIATLQQEVARLDFAAAALPPLQAWADALAADLEQTDAVLESAAFKEAVVKPRAQSLRVHNASLAAVDWPAYGAGQTLFEDGSGGLGEIRIEADGIEHVTLHRADWTDADATTLHATGHPLVAAGGAVWRRAREWLIGSAQTLTAVAIDTRQLPDDTGALPPVRVEVDVALPPWMDLALAENDDE